MMKIIDKILSLEHFREQPPVVIDIGASGAIHEAWKPIARYAVCLAFDADDREFTVAEDATGSGYRKLLRFNRIVTAMPKESAPFYLTASPFCSSLLEPEAAKLEPWVFSALFKVEKTVNLPAMTITQALQQAGIHYIDWFKADTQGTDLQLFLSLDVKVRQNVLACEFEPGIIDAYRGEDKLFTIMGTMKEEGFWLSSMQVKGTQRLHREYVAQLGADPKNLLRESPCWAELAYLHEASIDSERQYLLLMVFALLQEQYGFVLELCDAAGLKYKNPIFDTVRAAVLKQLKKRRFAVPLIIIKRKLRKLFR